MLGLALLCVAATAVAVVAIPSDHGAIRVGVVPVGLSVALVLVSLASPPLTRVKVAAGVLLILAVVVAFSIPVVPVPPVCEPGHRGPCEGFGGDALVGLRVSVFLGGIALAALLALAGHLSGRRRPAR